VELDEKTLYSLTVIIKRVINLMIISNKIIINNNFMNIYQVLINYPVKRIESY